MGEGGTKDTGVPPAPSLATLSQLRPASLCDLSSLLSGFSFPQRADVPGLVPRSRAQTPEPCELRLRPDIWLDLITISQVRLPGLS